MFPARSSPNPPPTGAEPPAPGRLPGRTPDFEARLRALLGPALVHVDVLPARPERTADPARPFAAPVAERLSELGLDTLRTHQAAAIDLLREGRSTVIATGTASGKTLCYQVPIAEAAIDGGTALCLFPTKALAQDQLRSFAEFGTPGLVPATYDGDTDPERRALARREATVLLSNPDMLHHGLLPNHERWERFLRRLRHVVVDELHVLRGVFGSNVAQVLRRLRRLCARYGSDPTFVFTSATIGDPGRLASELCGRPVETVSDDGSPLGERTVAFVDPGRTEVDGAPLSPNRVTAEVVASLVAADHRTLAFCRSRIGTEVVAAEVVRRHPRLGGRVRPYRGGYLSEERREIESQLFSGTLGGVVATSALELGVDIGGLDAVVLNGFPGTIASLWQQIGRAGRQQQPSLAVLIAGDDQLDHHFLQHPHEVFDRSPEPAVINPANPYVLDPHLACAAYEDPLTHDDEASWGDDLAEGVRRLVLGDVLRVRERGGRVRGHFTARGRPSRDIALRSGSAGEVRISFDDGTMIGTVDSSRAPDVVHPGAVYLHQGAPYRVVDLDLENGHAFVEPDAGREYTLARSDVELRVLDEERRRTTGSLTIGLGPVEVTSRVTGFQRREVLSGRVLDTVELDMPPSTLPTRGVWWEIPDEILDAAGLTPASVPGALHAAEHCGIGILPLFTICDRWDVGGVSSPWLADLASPAIVIHDAHPGGAGIADMAFEVVEDQLRATFGVLDSCSCENGCPSCVQSPKCGNLNEPLDRMGARALLEAAGFGA